MSLQKKNSKLIFLNPNDYLNIIFDAAFFLNKIAWFMHETWMQRSFFQPGNIRFRCRQNKEQVIALVVTLNYYNKLNYL